MSENATLPGRTSLPMDSSATLTNLVERIDGISEISVSGHDNPNMQGARGEHYNGTPFIRSPNASVDQAQHDPNMPFQ